MLIAGLIVAYLVASIPFGLMIGRLFFKKDIREFGSGNLGGTNTFRVLGKPAGFAVSFLDAGKGIFAIWLSYTVNLESFALIFGCAAILGQCFPLFAGFRGGKAVATTAGVVLMISPTLLVCGLAVFFLSLKLSKYVSLSSMVTCGLMTICSVLYQDLYLTLFLAVIASLIIYRHRHNIKRIKEKTEPKISWM